MPSPMTPLVESRLLVLAAHCALLARATLATCRAPRASDRTTADVARGYLKPQLSHLAHERFVVLCLNSRNVLLKQLTVADGSVDQCHVDPRGVLRGAQG